MFQCSAVVVINQSFQCQTDRIHFHEICLLRQIPLVDQLSESQLLGDVRFMRHRLDLMHRVAHMNKDKTKMLLHNIDPPDFNDTKGKDGLRRYIPDEELHLVGSVCVVQGRDHKV